MTDEELTRGFEGLRDKMTEEFCSLRSAVAATQATVQGVERRLETRVDDHATANREQHDGISRSICAVDQRVTSLSTRVNGIDRESAATEAKTAILARKAKVGLYGVAGGGSLVAVIEGAKQILALLRG